MEIWKHTFSYVPNFVIFGRIFRLSPKFVHFFTKLNIKFINMPSGVCVIIVLCNFLLYEVKNHINFMFDFFINLSVFSSFFFVIVYQLDGFNLDSQRDAFKGI